MQCNETKMKQFIKSIFASVYFKKQINSQWDLQGYTNTKNKSNTGNDNDRNDD